MHGDAVDRLAQSTLYKRLFEAFDIGQFRHDSVHPFYEEDCRLSARVIIRPLRPGNRSSIRMLAREMRAISYEVKNPTMDAPTCGGRC